MSSSNATILVGTVGQGVMRSTDAGETWRRVGVAQGMHSDGIVRCLTPDPRQPEVVYAGTDQGLLRTDDAGGTWRRLDTPMSGRTVWRLTIDDTAPDHMLAGTGTPSTPCIYQTADGGATWEPRAVAFADWCPAVGVPRPTALAIDPTDHRSVWLGVEVDGVRRSRDGGATWERAASEIANLDVHDILVTAGPPKRVFVLVNDEVWVSEDDGASWAALDAGRVLPWRYMRSAAARPDDPRVLFLTIGDSTPGRTGAVVRSCDAGQTWKSLPLPGQPNSAMWAVLVSREQPDVVLAGSRYGYLYRSDDSGDSWMRYWREFSEISALAWVPG